MPVNSRQRKQEAFQTVVKAYSLTKEAIGRAGALDYSDITGGQNAQYKRQDPMKYHDFVIDVELVLRRNLSAMEYKLFQEHMVNKELGNIVVSETLVQFQLKIGDLFIANGLHPVAEYYLPSSVIKRRREGRAA